MGVRRRVGRVVVLVACVIAVAGALGGGGQAGGLAAGGCLTGSPSAAYFRQARALARSAGHRVPLPTLAPAGAQLARFCVYPAPRSATDTTPGTGYTTFSLFHGRHPSPDPTTQNVNIVPLVAYPIISYQEFTAGTKLATVIGRPPWGREVHRRVHLGVYSVVHVFEKPDLSRPSPCGSSDWFFTAAGLVYNVHDAGKCGGKVPAGTAAAFLASLKPAY